MERDERKTPDLERRRFLSGAAGAVALSAGALAGCAPATSDLAKDAPFDHEVDVVVIGSGTGLVAALVARVAGADVLVLEKRKILGGTTGHSGGVAWIPNNNIMKAEGLSDDREKALVYLKKLSYGQATDELIEAFLSAGPEMADFVAAHSPIRWRVSTIMGNNADYHPEWPGAMTRGRSIEPTVDRPGMYGPDLIAGLQKGFEDAGGKIWNETPARRLIVKHHDETRREIVGVEAIREGKPIRIRARLGVHLATGGFEWDFELKKHFLRNPTLYTLGAGGNTGDGLRMAMAVGADLRNLNEVYGHTVYKEEAEILRPNFMGPTLNAEIEKRVAGSIIVNDRGERFHDEAADYDTTWRSFYTWENWGETRYRNVPAYLIFDGRVRENGKIAGASKADPLPGWVVEAKSLRELAEKLKIDPAGLEATVARFNAHAKKGVDPDFTRGKSHYDRYGSPDVGITLGPIEHGPFYGAEVAPADLGTCGGARVDGRAQVLDPFDAVIPGLSASGNCAGIGSPGASYGGGGGTIGPALTFAYIAGRELAAKKTQAGSAGA
jgi:succinate dehydrogenase/fumarate reductase flavoprotein subunit